MAKIVLLEPCRIGDEAPAAERTGSMGEFFGGMIGVVALVFMGGIVVAFIIKVVKG